MTELNTDHIEEYRLVADFLEKLKTTGVWTPVPEYIPEDKIEFQIYEHELPPLAWIGDKESRNTILLERFKALAKAIGGRWEKNDPKTSYFDDMYYTFTSVNTIGKASIRLLMQRDVICERVPVGTTIVEVPAVKAQKATTREETLYERECKPLFKHAEAELDKAMEQVGE